ncbi:MAG: hypothetical protein A2V85_15050 [Chloroflexi bacterium RBG_16_72_14]|nr:MAG: hypothetical protein A2V85_15050 [Chloroflexi bacterium RBG_16_72_14]
MGEGTDAARAAVLTARGTVDGELDRLEASARAAVDIKAKVRRNPARTAGLAAGAGFLLVGGPVKMLRGARNAIFGKPDPLPKSMLPREIDKALRELGADGTRVRGTLEREFAGYLKEHGPERRKRDLSGMAALVLSSVGKPLVDRYGRQLLEQLLDPDGPTVAEQLEKVKARRAAATGQTGQPAASAPADKPSTPPA